MFISMAETFPACIVISDMTKPGNPMFYVNDEFCKTTEYSKDESQGRNCSFLQGPETEPKSVEIIRNSLRRGIDCQVKLTNYKKSGKKFQNLLSMRPVHDSNGVYRFVVGVQFEVTDDKNSALKKRLKRLNGLLRLLPKKLEVPSCDLPQAKRRARASEVPSWLDENAGEDLGEGLQTPTPPTPTPPPPLTSTHSSQRHALCIQQLRPVLDHRSGLPTPLIKLIKTAWHHDPKCRPSFSQVLKMLREFDQMNVRQGTELFPSHEAHRRLSAQYCSSA
jgi:PAS domain S-box-containing protein